MPPDPFWKERSGWKHLAEVEPLEQTIEPWTSQWAGLQFLARFNMLTAQQFAVAA